MIFPSRKDNQLFITDNTFAIEMATLTNKKRMAALNKEKCEEYPRSNLAQNSNVPRSQEDYITQVSKEIEARVTKKLSQEISRTENRILGALAGPDDCLVNPLIQGHSGTAPETSQNAFSTSQGTNQDDSQSDRHTEAGIFHNQTARNFGPEGGHDMVTGVHEEVFYCSPNTSSGKQIKNRSTKQPQFRSENTPATIEADQILLALQQLADNNSSSKFHKNFNRNSKLPKSLTTTMPSFNGKSEKFELFEDLFHTSLKVDNQLREHDRINYFHSLMKGDASWTHKDNNGPTPEKELRKTPIDGESETQIPETYLQSRKSKVSRFSWRPSKTGPRRIRNSCPRHHRTIHLRQKTITTEDIHKSGTLGN